MHTLIARQKAFLFVVLILAFASIPAQAQTPEHSIARIWNEALLDAIRNDFARPTVHARNLFHTSAAMYDVWAVFEGTASPYLLGKAVDGFPWPFSGFTTDQPLETARQEALSFAVYRILIHRFKNSPNRFETRVHLEDLMDSLGYDVGKTSIDYSTGDAAALGNYIAEGYITFGLQDGANESEDYANISYTPVNPPLAVDNSDNSNLEDPNRWQPLTLDSFIDQSGNPIGGSIIPFLSPEWGRVSAFALTDEDKTVYNRDEFDYVVYHDPGPPPYVSVYEDTEEEIQYRWGFELVATWSSHLDPSDSVMWNISPGAIGNIPEYPTSLTDYAAFYDKLEGGDPSLGHTINPATGVAYPDQIVPRGDYTRVLAEFWADGPDSETPPGHWFTLLNYVNSHPDLERKIGGEGETLSPLEWDIKSYFTLGGAMHDAAVSVWGIKGWYDYIRPISAIRWMASQGQSTDPDLPSYHKDGIGLIPGYIELVESGDPVVGFSANIGKIKIYGWRGPDYIENPEVDEAGVGWILAEDWWPYQRPTFVTPPFAGYISGHSTFSSAAAEVLTLLTGDAYFPGGVGEFIAPKNEFLVFEEGPSQDVVLQWATYRDASDQCSLSRIWGGIHPPADDIPGRWIGIEIGTDAVNLAKQFFANEVTSIDPPIVKPLVVYPNPVRSSGTFTVRAEPGQQILRADLLLPQGSQIRTWQGSRASQQDLPTTGIPSGMYWLRVQTQQGVYTQALQIR